MRISGGTYNVYSISYIANANPKNDIRYANDEIRFGPALVLKSYSSSLDRIILMGCLAMACSMRSREILITLVSFVALAFAV